MTVWDEATPGAPRAVLVPGTMSCGTGCFAGQRPLAEMFRLEVVERRTAGASAARDAQDAQGVGQLLGHSAHLVGHADGAVVAVLAASARPEAVRSLTLIEPSARRERPAWDTRVPLGPLAKAAMPKVVVNGTWETAPHPGYPDCPEFTEEALEACGEYVAEAIGARHIRVTGAGRHMVNAVLSRLWQS